MPGVPSSRGCDACRRQKKKCDEAKPACGRCTRLGIECIGAAYKFQIHTKSQPPRKRSPKGSGSISASMAQQEQRERQIASSSPRGLFIHSTPTGNVHTAITGRLISALQVTDPRFDLSVYGSFLREIPRRIGSSPALDAAVSAWTATIPLAMAVPSTGLAFAPVAHPTVHMLHHYGYALATLRSSLSSRDSIAAPETLCALYLIVILQGWLQQEEDSFSSHGEAIATILSAMKQHQTAWGEFEHGIVKTLSFLVVMESLVNPRIQLDSHLLRRMADPEPLPAAKPHPQAISCLNNSYLVDVSTSLRDPYAHYSSLVEAYDRVRADRAKFAALIASIPCVSSADGRILRPTSQQLCSIHLRYQTGYATLTLIAIRIAVVLARIPWSYSSATSTRYLQLGGDLRIYVNDLATVAEQAVQYYPLGSSFMPLCLLAAYTTETSIRDDLQQRDRITQLFSRYRPGVDFQRICLKIKDVKEDSNAYGNSAPQVPDAAACSVENIDVLVTNHDMCCIL